MVSLTTPRRPVIVEVKPSASSTKSPTSSPVLSNRSISSSPKEVRFAVTPVETSRPLNRIEHWSAWHWEDHASRCAQCGNPSEVLRRGGRLCDAGQGFAMDIALHVRYQDGEFYSTQRDSAHNLVRVEIPANYIQLKDLLHAQARSVRARRPIISHAHTSPRLPSPTSLHRSDDPYRLSSKTARPKASTAGRRDSFLDLSATRYDDDADDLAVRAVEYTPRGDHRGSLYDRDVQRQKTAYRVELREPSAAIVNSEQGRRKERRRMSVWY